MVDQAKGKISITREQEMWAIALWVEKHHGDVGDVYVSQQMDRLLAADDLAGMAYWGKVRDKLERLCQRVRIPS